MAPRNDSFTTQFILAGLTDQSILQLPLFFLFLVMYMVTVMGNLSLIILIGLSSHLHTPMYFFLFNLSFIDLCYSSVFTPKMLINIISKKIISYMGYMTQIYFFIFLVFLNAMCWHQWPVMTMWPSVTHCCVTLPCPLKCVPGLCLILTWWHFLVPWFTLDTCWVWPSVMQTLSTIICVTPALCSSSPTQVPASLSWKLSSCQESTSLCAVSPSCLLRPHSLQHPSHQVRRGQI